MDGGILHSPRADGRSEQPELRATDAQRNRASPFSMHRMTINRRDFLGVAGGALAGSSLLNLPLLGAGTCGPPLRSRLIPEDKGVTNERLAQLRQRGDRRAY